MVLALAVSSSGLLPVLVRRCCRCRCSAWPILGGCQVAYYATTNTLIQLLVPMRLRGRVMSLYILASTGGAPFGNLLAGFMAEHFGVQATLTAMARRRS